MHSLLSISHSREKLGGGTAWQMGCWHPGAGTGKHASQIEKVRKQAAALGVPHESLSKHDLNVLTDNAVHQVSWGFNGYQSLVL